MQVAEHPLLASVREALLVASANDEKVSTKTMIVEGDAVSGAMLATPILLRGVERRAVFAVDKNAEQERPEGLYGNVFASAPASAITKAVTLLPKSTFTNFIAIVAPKFGRGSYTQEQYERILATAYTGFMAARLESVQATGPPPLPSPPPHPCQAPSPSRPSSTRATGALAPLVATRSSWPCARSSPPAWPVRLPLLPLLSPPPGIEKLVYHTNKDDGPVDEAIDRLEELLGKKDQTLAQFLKKLLKLDLQWGTGNMT